MIPSRNFDYPWSGRPDLLGHDKGRDKTSPIDRLGMTTQLVATVRDRHRFVHAFVRAALTWVPFYGSNENLSRISVELFGRRVTLHDGSSASQLSALTTIVLP